MEEAMTELRIDNIRDFCLIHAMFSSSFWLFKQHQVACVSQHWPWTQEGIRDGSRTWLRGVSTFCRILALANPSKLCSLHRAVHRCQPVAVTVRSWCSKAGPKAHSIFSFCWEKIDQEMKRRGFFSLVPFSLLLYGNVNWRRGTGLMNFNLFSHKDLHLWLRTNIDQSNGSPNPAHFIKVNHSLMAGQVQNKFWFTACTEMITVLCWSLTVFHTGELFH